MDYLLLTTTGRHSGKKHTVPLLYLRDGSNLVAIASFGGKPRHPDWFHNLTRDPNVTVQVGGDRFPPWPGWQMPRSGLACGRRRWRFGPITGRTRGEPRG